MSTDHRKLITKGTARYLHSVGSTAPREVRRKDSHVGREQVCKRLADGGSRSSPCWSGRLQRLKETCKMTGEVLG